VLGKANLKYSGRSYVLGFSVDIRLPIAIFWMILILSAVILSLFLLKFWASLFDFIFLAPFAYTLN